MVSLAGVLSLNQILFVLAKAYTLVTFGVVVAVYLTTCRYLNEN